MSILKRYFPEADVLIPYIGTIVLILISSVIYPQILSLDYLSQQLQIAAFLGVLALGATLVILLGHIDLSIPWVLGGGAIISTALVGSDNSDLSMLAIPIALIFGAGVGAINGFGVAVLRIPSMVWTLSVNSMLLGISVLITGGFNPKGEANEVMGSLATGKIAGIPIAFCIWMLIAFLINALLKRSNFGRYLSAVGYNEKATYLSGVSTTFVIIFAFIIAGICSAFGGVLLAGYANQAYQSMGEPFLLPTIAAVVIGGTSILGGRGSLIGTIGGVLFITLLNSILSIIQISEAWRNINFGAIIILMLLFQSLRQKGA
jgi:ribose transport system permease protein|tara:strand:+ start:5427 stop:6380 length:954 start_codon:yes stop_codon:yes gene_type:complete